MEYYLAIKSNKILISVTTWVDFDNMLHEEASHKNTHILYDFIYLKFLA